MFDVIHVLYVEDMTPLWEKHIDAKDRIREAVYPLLYDRPYKFSHTKEDKPFDPVAAGYDDPAAGSPFGTSEASQELKPFIPVTSEEDLMKVLEGPMG